MPLLFISLGISIASVFTRPLDKVFLPLIVKTKQPCLAIDRDLPDDIIQVIAIPTFPAGLLPPSPRVNLRQRHPEKGLVGKSGDPCFPGSLFQPPLKEEKLAIISQLGVNQECKKRYG